MKIIYQDEKIAKIELPCKTITTIDADDLWIADIFTVWGITGSRSKYVFVERTIKTPYSFIRERVYLHRLIMKITTDKKNSWAVDHKNRDRLDNRKCNLRYATKEQNMANTVSKKRSNSGYRGVSLHKRKLKKKYVAYIGSGCTGSRKNIGYFDCPIAAAKAYDAEAKKRYGEFAILNFPDLDLKSILD